MGVCILCLFLAGVLDWSSPFAVIVAFRGNIYLFLFCFLVFMLYLMCILAFVWVFVFWWSTHFKPNQMNGFCREAEISFFKMVVLFDVWLSLIQEHLKFLDRYVSISAILKPIPYLYYTNLSQGVASESDITLCMKFDKPLVVYRFW